jgi:hypothetical protein
MCSGVVLCDAGVVMSECRGEGALHLGLCMSARVLLVVHCTAGSSPRNACVQFATCIAQQPRLCAAVPLWVIAPSTDPRKLPKRTDPKANGALTGTDRSLMFRSRSGQCPRDVLHVCRY